MCTCINISSHSSVKSVAAKTNINLFNHFLPHFVSILLINLLYIIYVINCSYEFQCVSEDDRIVLSHEHDEGKCLIHSALGSIYIKKMNPSHGTEHIRENGEINPNLCNFISSFLPSFNFENIMNLYPRSWFFTSEVTEFSSQDINESVTVVQ